MVMAELLPFCTLFKYDWFVDILSLNYKIWIGSGVIGRSFTVGGWTEECGVKVNGVFGEIEVIYGDTEAAGRLLTITDSNVEKAIVGISDFEGIGVFFLNDLLHFLRNGIFGQNGEFQIFNPGEGILLVLACTGSHEQKDKQAKYGKEPWKHFIWKGVEKNQVFHGKPRN